MHAFVLARIKVLYRDKVRIHIPEVRFERLKEKLTRNSLAYATLHLTVAHLLRRFKIVTKGYTTEHDMDWNDRFVPVPNGRIRGLVRERPD